MNKRNAAAAANGGQEEESSSADSANTFNQQGSLGNDRLRNPFADDEDDDEAGSGSGSGSDDGDIENLGNEAVGSSSWNRGSWWRGVVRSARRGNRGRGGDKSSRDAERFGDGRDDSDSDGAGDDDDAEEDIEDEEFGDFEVADVDGKTRDGSAPGGMVSGIDPAREKILVKPLPVHPNSVKTGGPFGSLWPFSTQPFGAKKEEGSIAEKAGENGATSEKSAVEASKLEDSEEVVGEDGHKIDRAVEAKSRTSIEDPDDEEIIVAKPIIN
jgi:SIT4-associating protein SAP185/190